MPDAENTPQNEAVNFDDFVNNLVDDQDKDEVVNTQQNESDVVDFDKNEENDGDGETHEQKTAEPPVSLADAAERLGVKVEDLYNLKVKYGDQQDGETLTIGELKDLGAVRNDINNDKFVWEEEKLKQEQTINRARSELATIIEAIPEQFRSEEVLKQVSTYRAQLEQRHRADLLAVKPEWKNTEIEQRDREFISEHLKNYGFPKGYVDGLQDASTLAYLHKMALREQRINEWQSKTAVKQTPKAEKPTRRPATPKGKPSLRPNAGKEEQIDAIAAILAQNT